MKTKLKKFWFVPVLLAAAAALMVTVAAKLSEEAPVPVPVPSATIPSEENVLTEQEREEYEQLQKRIDQGDSVGFARLLLDGGVSDDLYEYLTKENPALIERILLDAMVQFGTSGELEPLVRLRQMGYLTDSCFYAYWNTMGNPLPEETETAADLCLVHELHMAYLRDPYALRSLREMRTAGILDDVLHAALTEKLGFDYMDDSELESSQVDTVHTLTPQEKEAYDSVLEAIDQGDYTRIVSGMLNGEITVPVYQKLMETDGEVMDSILALGMASLAEEGRFQELVRLCVEGFISDTCYQNYWKLEGFDLPEASGGEDYLLYELEMIYRQNGNSSELLRQIWRSGVLGDDIHRKLIDRLGVDYTQGE